MHTDFNSLTFFPPNHYVPKHFKLIVKKKGTLVISFYWTCGHSLPFYQCPSLGSQHCWKPHRLVSFTWLILPTPSSRPSGGKVEQYARQVGTQQQTKQYFSNSSAHPSNPTLRQDDSLLLVNFMHSLKKQREREKKGDLLHTNTTAISTNFQTLNKVQVTQMHQ